MFTHLRVNDAFEHSLLTTWVESAGVGLCVLDETLTVVVVNRSACGFVRVEPSAVTNRSARIMFRAALNSVTALEWASQDHIETEFVLRIQLDKALQYIQLKKSWMHDSEQKRYLVICLTDVTALRAAIELEQKKLAEGLRQWQALCAGVVIADALLPDMPIIYVNPAFERMTGYSSREILGRNCRFMQGTDEKQLGVQAIRDAIKSQKSGYAVLRNYRKDGSCFVNELFISPVRNEWGTVTQFVGIQHLRSDNFV